MMALYFKQFIDPTFLEGISERGRRRVFKVAMIQAMRYWHKNILPKHFKKSGQDQYPGSFEMPDNIFYSSDTALNRTGKFREFILSQGNKVVGTFKGAKIKYLFGRPEATKRALRIVDSVVGDLQEAEPEWASDKKKGYYTRKIFASMRGRHITFEAARAELIGKQYGILAYNNRVKKLMVAGVSVFNQSDRDEIRAFVQKFIEDNYQNLGRANYRKLEGAEF